MTSYLRRLDPELAQAIGAQPPGPGLDLSDLKAARARMGVIADIIARQRGAVTGVTQVDHRATGPAGQPDVAVRSYRPDALTSALPALLSIHGGGYMLGNLRDGDDFARRLALAVGCVVIEVEYRLAPEHPYPAALDDVHAAWRWLLASHETLGIDVRRVGLRGASAGGGLAAALTLRLRDAAETLPCYQMLDYPMLDDRCNTSSALADTDPRVWNLRHNTTAWAAYLGPLAGAAAIPMQAAPARAQDFSGLPPACVMVGSADLFVDEAIAYAQGLNRAGVATELVVLPGGFHGCDLMLPGAKLSRRFEAQRVDALRRGLGVT